MKKSKYIVTILLMLSLTGVVFRPSQTLAAEANQEGISAAPISQHALDLASIQVEKTVEGEELVKAIGESTQKATQSNDLYASVIIAQALLESRFGTSKIAQDPYNNLFAMLANDQETGISFSKTIKDENDTINYVMTKYRIYLNYQAAVTDYMSLLIDGLAEQEDLYAETWRKNAKTYQEATQALALADNQMEDYGDKLNETIELYNLTIYDELIKVEKKVAAKKAKPKKEKVDIEATAKFKTYKYQLPLKAYQVTSEFGSRYHPIYGDLGSHHGIDLAAPQGTSVAAAKDGTVVESGFHNSAGNYVIVQHSDGLYTSYFHLETITTQAGAVLVQGEKLGTVGSTGDSTGAHLHFAYSNNVWSDYLDPRIFISI